MGILLSGDCPMLMPTVPRLSAAEFERLYLGKRAELWRGEVREYMPAGPKHGKVALSIGAEIRAHARRGNLGVAFAAEPGFIVRTPAGESVLAPDAAFIRRERLPEGDLPSGFCPIVPDLVVEVVSPSDSETAIREKVNEWLAGGVLVVWVVDPQRRIVEVWTAEGMHQSLGEEDWLTGEPVLPGFRVAVRDLLE
jgi:Uma2 family endonuclease